jgi:hypothetical protein
VGMFSDVWGVSGARMDASGPLRLSQRGGLAERYFCNSSFAIRCT